MGEKIKNASPIISCLPPYHTILFMLTVAVLAFLCWPEWETFDKDLANLETLTDTSPYFNRNQIGWIRLFFSSIMLGDSFYAVLYGEWEQDFEYDDECTKLLPAYKIPFRGYFRQEPTSKRSLFRALLTLSSFTMWAWMIEGVAFLGLGIMSLSPSTSFSPWFCRITALLWEVSAPTSLLVSAIVKYVLWPFAQQSQNEDANNVNVLKHPGALLEHNLNSIAALVEVGFLSGLPVRARDAGLAVLFGLTYVLYSYYMASRWIPATTGKSISTMSKDKPELHQPHFMYPFLDPTLPEFGPTNCILGLLLVLLISHVLFCLADTYIHKLNPFVMVPLVALVVCRVRD